MSEWAQRASRTVEEAWGDFLSLHGPDNYRVFEEGDNYKIFTKPYMGFDVAKLERNSNLSARDAFTILSNISLNKRWAEDERIND